MPISFWFTLLTVHIALPAALCFAVIYYTWRFFAFVRRKFTQFRLKVDGYDDMHTHPKKQSYNRPIHKEEISDLLIGDLYIMPNTKKGERNHYEVNLNYKSHAVPISLNEKVTNSGYKVLKDEGEDAFFDWLSKQVSGKRYSKMTYTSLKSLKEQVAFYSSIVFEDRPPMFSKERDFVTLCLFIELYLLQDKGLINWVKELPDKSKNKRSNKPKNHQLKLS